MYWLIAQAVRQQIEQAYASGAVPSVEQQVQFEARYGYDDGDAPRILTTAGDVAQITVAGAITKSPSLLAMLFGGGNVTYPEIIAALNAADKDPDVKRIEMAIDSPGGMIDGLFEAIAAMQAVGKPIRAVVRNQATSAAYALASQADEIVAQNRSARVGSIGIVAAFKLDENRVELTSSKAPKKRPDLTTEEGKAEVIEELDALHDLFVEAIATGRGVTPEQVNAEYGQGGTFVADKALKRGMIDSVAGFVPRVVKSATPTKTASDGGNTSETGPMDLKTLRAEHPEAYAAAVAEGVEQERDRVGAFLEAGTASGMMDDAIKAVQEGSAMTATLMTRFTMGAVNRRDQQNRQDDDLGAQGADGADAGGDAGAENGADVAALVEQGLGIEGGQGHA